MNLGSNLRKFLPNIFNITFGHIFVSISYFVSLSIQGLYKAKFHHKIIHLIIKQIL